MAKPALRALIAAGYTRLDQFTTIKEADLRKLHGMGPKKSYLLVASNGGAPNHPFWYLNLVENSEVEIQVGADKFAARARTVTKKEKPRLWKLMSKIFPHYDKYQAKAGRDIPLVIVEPV